MKHPLYRKILERLEGEIDPQVFEDCMCDLLRDTWPGLVPIRGGSDAGWDGAIADGEGEAFPLVCTTESDVIGNLTKSLKSFLASERPPRKVVLATSRSLTPQRRRNLEERAREMGFTPVQIIDRRGVADRLYRNSRWRQELLCLSGSPSALSVVPPSWRPPFAMEPVGRDADLEWLRTTRGDRVLSGEPGSGKTFLLHHLAREGWGLFLASDDETEVANGLRDQEPKVVVVDDAHVDPGRLVRLRRLREEVGAEFDIVAVTWGGDLDAVVEALGPLPSSQIHRLELLPRAQIVEVLRRAAIDDDDVLRDLADQAANKPGLAVTLARLWLMGEWQEILDGKALSRNVLETFRNLVGPDAEDLLAALSLGGDRGMDEEAVRDFLGLNRAETRRKTASLAAGGVLSEAGDGALAVVPVPLRLALIRQAFFPGSGVRHREYRPLIEKAPSFASSIEALLLARSRGAAIPSEALRELLLELEGRAEPSLRSTAELWRIMACLGRDDARWVLDSYPGDVLEVADAALDQVPEQAIRLFLDRAAEEARTGEPRSGSALDALGAWVQRVTGSPGDLEQALRRRQLLARAARKYLQEGGDPGTGLGGICLALSPLLCGDRRDPVGTTFYLSWSFLPLDSRIQALWDQVKDALPSIDARGWQYLSRMLQAWLHPDLAVPSDQFTPELLQATDAFALKMLRDLAPLARSSPGLTAGLRRLAAGLSAELPLEPDPVFELLYPEPAIDPDEASAQAAAALRDLAALWANEAPAKVAERLAWYEREAATIGFGWRRHSYELSRELAGAVGDPRAWFEAFLDHQLPDPLVRPFLEHLTEIRAPRWEEHLGRALELFPYQGSALELILKLPDPPAPLLEKALDRIAGWSFLVESLCLRREVPLSTLRRLLQHPRWETALLAAVGEWNADRKEGARQEVLADWRAAILRAKTDSDQEERRSVGGQFWLGEILKKDPDLALAWLRNRLRDKPPDVFKPERGPFGKAIAALTQEQRMQLLEEMRPISALKWLLPPLIGRDAELYRKLLSRSALAPFHLTPLFGPPDRLWLELAIVALSFDYTPKEIAESADLGGVHSMAGVDYWRRWAHAFEALEAHPREDVREVGRHGRAIVAERLGSAEAFRRQIELQGL